MAEQNPKPKAEPISNPPTNATTGNQKQGTQLGTPATAHVKPTSGPATGPAPAPVANANKADNAAGEHSQSKEEKEQPTDNAVPRGGNEAAIEDEEIRQAKGGGTPNARALAESMRKEQTGEPRTREATEQDLIEDARERSKSGNVYRVTGNVMGGPAMGTIAADTDFPQGTDFMRLIRLNAVEPVDGLRSDPNAALRSPDSLDEVERLHDECNRLTRENERLTRENEQLRKDAK